MDGFINVLAIGIFLIIIAYVNNRLFFSRKNNHKAKNPENFTILEKSSASVPEEADPLEFTFIDTPLPEVETGPLELTFTVHLRHRYLSKAQIVIKADKKDEEPPPEQDYTLQVVLQNGYFSYINDQFNTIYDLTRRRILKLNLHKKEYMDHSLFSEIGFRVAEFQNRLWMGSIFQKMDIQDFPVRSPAQIEHLFSLRSEATTANITLWQDDKFIGFQTEKQNLLTFSLAGLPINQVQMNRFIKFLRYYLGGHPLILEKLTSEGRIPRYLKFTNYDGPYTRTWSLTLNSARNIPQTAYSLDDFKPWEAETSQDELIKLIHQTQLEAHTWLPKQRASLLIKQTEQAFSQGKYLEAMLGYMEYYLQTGTNISTFSARQLERLHHNKHVQELAQILSPKDNKADFEKAIRVLQKLHQSAGQEHAHVLLIYEANNQTALGQFEQAKQLFFTVLQQNPYIAGVYKDLGEIYYGDYYASEAWRCWDLARQLAPDHPLLHHIDAFEQQLLEEYPEYF